jgi:hypothetical protein
VYASDGNPTKLDSALVPMRLSQAMPNPGVLHCFWCFLHDADLDRRFQTSSPDFCNLLVAPGGSALNEGSSRPAFCHEPPRRIRDCEPGQREKERERERERRAHCAGSCSLCTPPFTGDVLLFPISAAGCGGRINNVSNGVRGC